MKHTTLCRSMLLSNRPLSSRCFDLRVLCPEISAAATPGQFVHILCGERQLRRPIAIADADGDCLRLIVERVGPGTEWLCRRRYGDSLDLIGPLGNGFPAPGDFSESGGSPPRSERVLLVGGGSGAAPLLFAARRLENARAALGFSGKASVMLLPDFVEACDPVRIATEDGSIGFHGPVDALAAEMLAEEPFAAVFACGPAAMVRALIAHCEAHAAALFISHEARMGCGIGACGACACRISTEDGLRDVRVCTDGPVFEARRIVELVDRPQVPVNTKN